MKFVRSRIARYAVVTGVALAVVAQSLAAAIPAHAQGVQSPAYFDRQAVIKRAKTWTDKGVPYSQTGWYKNYRTDCSGFVSMAWNLDQSFVTWSFPEIAKPISKNELQPGDVLIQQNHMVIFGGWANKQRTAYTIYEQVGGGIHRAIQRVVPYPYDSNPSVYKPYRYTGGHSLDAPGNLLPTALMATNAGGHVGSAPDDKAAQLNQRIERVAAQRKAKADAEARQRAEAKAKLAAQQAAAKARKAEEAKAVPTLQSGAAPSIGTLFHSLLVFLER